MHRCRWLPADGYEPVSPRGAQAPLFCNLPTTARLAAGVATCRATTRQNQAVAAVIDDQQCCRQDGNDVRRRCDSGGWLVAPRRANLVAADGGLPPESLPFGTTVVAVERAHGARVFVVVVGVPGVVRSLPHQFDPRGLHLSANRGRCRGCASGSCPQPDAQTISPACRLPRAANSLRFAGSPLRCDRKRCGRPAIASPIAVKAAMGAT